MKAAVSLAVNRKHDKVEEKDVLDGEKQYSQYAWDSILVENGITIPELEGVLLEFLCSESVVTDSVVRERILSAGFAPERIDSVVSHLVKLTFLGLEVAEGQLLYSDEFKELKKHEVLAEHLVRGSRSGRRCEINPAFRSYLQAAER